MKFLKVKEMAELIGVHEDTLRRWDNNENFPCHHRTSGGQRVYSIEQAACFLKVTEQEVLDMLKGVR